MKKSLSLIFSLIFLRTNSAFSTSSSTTNHGFLPTRFSTMTTAATPSVSDRIAGSIIGFYAGDALAMPVHWYYNIAQLEADFGRITKYEAPKPKFAGSILNLSNTGGGGRGSDKGNIIGDVICHGKKQFWIKGGDFHYHHGMKAGENTLDALVSRVLQQSIISKSGIFDQDDFRSKYISFMTTPGSHNDSYAGTAHRMFFANWMNGVEPHLCPDNDGHNVDSIDALMVVPIITMAYLDATRESRYDAVKKAIQTTRRTSVVLRYANIYSDMLVSIIKEGVSVRDAALTASNAIGIDMASEVRRSGSSRDPMTACYIENAFPVMLFMAVKYGNFEGDGAAAAERMLLASANAGGENVARGSLLGSLVGASVGLSAFPASLKDGLTLAGPLKEEAQQFSTLFTTPCTN